jgi:hypothetical protein
MMWRVIRVVVSEVNELLLKIASTTKLRNGGYRCLFLGQDLVVTSRSVDPAVASFVSVSGHCVLEWNKIVRFPKEPKKRVKHVPYEKQAEFYRKSSRMSYIKNRNYTSPQCPFNRICKSSSDFSERVGSLEFDCNEFTFKFVEFGKMQ